jgi:hypothetical protein
VSKLWYASVKIADVSKCIVNVSLLEDFVMKNVIVKDA